MSTNVSSVTKHFPSPQNGFTTTTSGSVSSGAATVGLNSVAGYTNGQTAVFVIDPTDASKKQTFTGTIDTSGSQVTGVKWTAGTNQTHALGATVVDYATATHIAMISKGIKVEHNDDGTHSDITATSLTVDTLTVNDSTTTAGYNALGVAPSAVAANGNRSYTLTFSSVDYTDRLSPGMRLQTTRTVAAPTQCTSLNGTTQYYSKSSPSGMTFTDDFVVSAWVKLTSYPATFAAIASCYNGTSGWSFDINSSGQVRLIGLNGGASNYGQVLSYQSLPLNKWVHVAAQLDMSTHTATTTTSYVMIDGVDVPAAHAQAGTNPTALIQAGSLNIGAQNSLLFWPGKIAQVAIYNAKVTQANIKATISQGLTGNETSLISAYSFNNSINDLNANANNLTAQASAVATNADSPFGGQADGTISSTLDYAIIQKASFSTDTTVTVQVPEGCTIPTSGGVSAVSYSTQKAPYGFPAQRGKWIVENLGKVDYTANSGGSTNGTWYKAVGSDLTVPIGEWTFKAMFSPYADKAGGDVYISTTITSSGTTETDSDMTSAARASSLTSTSIIMMPTAREKNLSLSAATTYAVLMRANVTGISNLLLTSTSYGSARIFAENAYL